MIRNNSKFKVQNSKMMYASHIFIFLIFTFTFAKLAFADIDIGGYYKNDLQYLIKRSGEGITADVNKLRVRFDSKLLPNLNLHLEPQYVTMVKSQDIPLLDASQLNKLIWDRTYLKMNLPLADITAGKQRVAWGTGHLFNPTDIFNPFDLSFAVAEEERQGIESVRFEIPLGVMSVLDAVVLTDSKKGIKAKTTLGAYDISVSYVDMGSGESQAGFDTAGELFGFGVRAEAALVSPKNYLKYVVGWGYTLENGLGMDMEYYYNGLGKKNKNDYDWDQLSSGNVSQLGMDYVYFGLNKNLDEITSIRLSFLINADDLGFIVYPSYSRNIYQNIDISLEALIEYGTDGSEVRPTDQQDTTKFLGSSMLFTRLRYSF